MNHTMNELAQQLSRSQFRDSKKRDESTENKIKLWNSLDKGSQSSLGRRENKRYQDEDNDDDDFLGHEEMDEAVVQHQFQKPP